MTNISILVQLQLKPIHKNTAECAGNHLKTYKFEEILKDLLGLQGYYCIDSWYPLRRNPAGQQCGPHEKQRNHEGRQRISHIHTK